MKHRDTTSKILFCAAVLFLFMIPEENNPQWMEIVIVTKGIAAGLFLSVKKISTSSMKANLRQSQTNP